MSIIDTLVTDRTQADVSALKALSALGWDNMTSEQKAAWSASKGAYNARDLNRVGEACSYLYNELSRYGFIPAGYVPLRTDWIQEEIPTAAEMATYLETLISIKEVFDTEIELPETMSRFSVEGANSIEKMLASVYAYLKPMFNDWWYSGEIYAGEGY